MLARRLARAGTVSSFFCNEAGVLGIEVVDRVEAPRGSSGLSGAGAAWVSYVRRLGMSYKPRARTDPPFPSNAPLAAPNM